MVEDRPLQESPQAQELIPEAERRRPPANLDFPLIRTKIQIPRRRAELLSRRRLVDRLHGSMDRKLVILSAPAGYGKTSLLVDFACETDLPVCWLTLDAINRDLRIFMEYFIAALAAHYPAFGAKSLQFLKQTVNLNQNLYGLCAVITQEIHEAIPEYFILILDDFHTVDLQDSIAEFLDLFITYVDENCHLVIASRNLVALPNLVLLIARRQALGMSADELRFTREEIQEYVRKNFSLGLPDKAANALVDRTNGWITGMLLSSEASWRQGNSDPPPRGKINQELYDYLSSQLLDQQPAPLRRFMQSASLLDELDPSLISSVLGIPDSNEMLEEIRSRSLFTVIYPGEEDAMRFHDLFRDFLRASLMRQDGVLYRNLMRKVADAYAARGFIARAIERYLGLGETMRAVDLMEQAGENYYITGRWETLTRWIDNLPKELLSEHPALMVQRARIFSENGQNAQALDLLQQARSIYTRRGESARIDAGRVLALKSSVLRIQDRYTESIGYAQQALLAVGGDSLQERYIQAMAQKNLGLCCVWLGKLEEGLKSLRSAMRKYEELASPLDIGLIQHDLGLVQELTGNLAAAEKHYRLALATWQKLENPSPWANELNSLGVVYSMQGKYSLAAESFAAAMEKALLIGDLRIQAYILAGQADLQRELGNLSEARAAFERTLEVAQRANTALMVTYALDGLANIARLEGDFAQASYRLDEALGYAQEHGSAYELGLCNLSQGMLSNELGKVENAQLHLEEAIHVFQDSGLQPLLARARLHHAQTWFLAGRLEQAEVELNACLDLTGRLGFDQFMVVDGARLLPLFQAILRIRPKNAALVHLTERVRLYLESLPGKKMEVPIPVAPALPQLRVLALGQPEIYLDGKAVQWELTKSRDLFFLLLMNPHGLTREQIGGLFWPDYNSERLEPAFRSTMYRLRRALFRDCILYQDGLYRVNWQDGHWLDVHEFDLLIAQAETLEDPAAMAQLLLKALALYRGEFLQGCYEDWSNLERERLRNRRRFACEKLAAYYVQDKKFERAIELYQRLVSEDAYNEDAHRELIRCYALQGDRASAIRQYQTLTRLLWDDLGLRPSPETEKLYLQIID